MVLIFSIFHAAFQTYDIFHGDLYLLAGQEHIIECLAHICYRCYLIILCALRGKFACVLSGAGCEEQITVQDILIVSKLSGRCILIAQLDHIAHEDSRWQLEIVLQVIIEIHLRVPVRQSAIDLRTRDLLIE